MIAAPFLVSFGIALAPQLNDAQGTNSPVEFEHSISLSLQIEETHIAAQSWALAPLLIIFASEDHEMQTAFWLPPGARYEEDFPRGTLTGFELEVLDITEGRWISSASIVLSDSLPLLRGGLWVLDCGHVLAQSEGEPLTAVSSIGSTLPPRLAALTNQNQELGSAGDHGFQQHGAQFHVPVPTPTDRPKTNKPPKLRPKPLPPV